LKYEHTVVATHSDLTHIFLEKINKTEKEKCFISFLRITFYLLCPALAQPANRNDNRHLLPSRFRYVQSNYEATSNLFNHFWYPLMYFNRNNLKTQTKIFEQKFKKRTGVPLAFFSVFTQKLIFLNL